MFIHTFALRFKPDTENAQITGAIEGTLALKDQIPGLLAAHVGRNVSPRGQGFAMGGVMHFEDAQAFERYHAHPAHQALLATFGPVLADAIEVDFNSEA